MTSNPDSLIGNIIDRALSPKPGEVDEAILVTQKRLLGEKLVAEVIPTLIELKADPEQALRLMHKLTTVGMRAYDDVNASEELHGGKYRDHEVAIGEFVPPKHEDVQQLVSQFAGRLSELQYQATATSIDHVSAWAYAVLIAIHPFADGNGRTGRALMEFVRKQFEIERNQSLPELNIDTDDRAKEEMAVQLEAVIQQLGLVPTGGENGTAMEVYKAAVVGGNADAYFNAVSELLRTHLAEKFTPNDLQFDPRFSGVVELIRKPIDKLKTVPLITRYATTVGEEVLSGTTQSASHPQS